MSKRKVNNIRSRGKFKKIMKGGGLIKDYQTGWDKEEEAKDYQTGWDKEEEARKARVAKKAWEDKPISEQESLQKKDVYWQTMVAEHVAKHPWLARSGWLPRPKSDKEVRRIAELLAEDIDWETDVAEFDKVMATDPDQFQAARAAWARGERQPDTSMFRRVPPDEYEFKKFSKKLSNEYGVEKAEEEGTRTGTGTGGKMMKSKKSRKKPRRKPRKKSKNKSKNKYKKIKKTKKI